MTVSAPVRLLLLGFALCGTLLVGARLGGVLGGPTFLMTMTTAAILYLLAVREFLHAPHYPCYIVPICLVLAALWRVPFLLSPPGPQDDVLRYLWDGRLQRLGYNPYTTIPSDPALAKLHTAETRQLNNPDVPSPYPAGAQLFFRLVTAVHESAFAFKVAFVACDLMIVLVLLAELRSGGREYWVLAYAWHPLLVPCVAYNGHLDIVGAGLLLISAIALQRNCSRVAAIAFGLAVAVKFLPVVLIPLYWRRIRLEDGLLAAVIVILLYLPFVQRGHVPIGSISAVLERFRFNDPVFAIVERIVRPRWAAAIAIASGLSTALWLRRKEPLPSPEAWAWPMAASLVCAPVVYPWYLLWLVPFLRSASAWPLIIWTLSILSIFFVWYWHTLGHVWKVPGWLLLLEFGLVAVTALGRMGFEKLNLRGRGYFAK